jgi:DNA-binding response OmpR family regulator
MLSFFSRKWTELKQNWISKEVKSHPCRVLCVDDDVDFCQYIEKLALPLGIQCDKAFSMEGAKQKINEDSTYTAFIIDGHLPDASGLELVAWIREKKGLNTPIGFLSRVYHDAASFRILKESLRVDYVLEKPIQPSAAAKLLNQLCSLNRELVEEEGFPDYLLAEAKLNYQKTISDKIERLERMIQLVQQSPDQKNLQNLRFEVHKLAGSSGSYGYSKVSHLCKAMEQELINRTELSMEIKLDPAWLASLDIFFRELKLHFQINSLDEKALAPFPSPPSGKNFPLYIIDDNPTFSEEFKQIAKDKYEYFIEPNAEIALEVIKTPDFYSQVVLMGESVLTASPELSDSLIGMFVNSKKKLFPVIGFICEQNWKSLSQAVKRGFPYILIRPFSDLIINFLMEESLNQGLKYKVLIIDDDFDSLQFITQSLKYFGFEIQSLNDPLLLQATLMNYHPDVLLVDIDLSNEKKVDVLHLLQRTQYKKILVAMVTISQESNLIKTIYGSAVDDILFKPLESTILQKRVLNLIRKINEEGDSCLDPTTGLLQVQFFHDYLNAIILNNHDLSFDNIILFEMDHYHIHKEKMGQHAFETMIKKISQAINQKLMIEKKACYLGKGRFVLFSKGYDQYYLRLLMLDFLEKFQSQSKENNSLSFYCGISNVKKNGQFLEQFEKSFQKKNEKVDVKILDLFDSPRKQLNTYIFESNYLGIEQLVQLFEEEGLNVFLNEEIEKSISGLSSDAGMIFVFIGNQESRLNSLKKELGVRNIRMPVIYLPFLAIGSLSPFLKEGVKYKENPFNFILMIGS